MATVTGPLMSLDASGSVAKTITFSKWKGRNYVRQLVTPSNPQTSDQVTTRTVLGVIAKAAVSVLTSFKDPAHAGSLFFQAARDLAPSGQSWLSWMQGTLFSRFYTDQSDYDGLSGTIHGYFVSTGTDIGLVSYTAPNSVTAYTAGAQLYELAIFASVYLTGDVKDAADLAIAGASQGNVDAFGEMVHLTVA